LVAQLEQEFSEGSAEAETAEAPIEAIERERDEINDARHEIPRLKPDRDVRLYRR
jgi:hypothetical protein